MAQRNNTFLIKRSNIPGKIPASGDLLLGELALNTADVILYASGTTANSILPIGWDRVARTGDTMTGPLYGPLISATTISATSLNVNGSFKYIDGNQSSGKILTSDANGNASWQNSSIVGNLIYFFKNTASDIPTYLQATIEPQLGPIQTITNLSVTADTLLATFATASGGTGFGFFPAGLVEMHIHAAVTNSNPKPTQLYFKLFKRTSGGTETLLGTSSNSTTLNGTQGEYTTDIGLSATTANTTDRLVVKVYALTTGLGPNPDIDLYVEDSTLSRIQMPSATVNSSNFVPYTGATGNVILGNYNISANNGVFNSVSATTISSSTLTVSGVTFNKLLKEKVGLAAGSGFTGNPKKFTVTFGANFADTNYAIILTGPANRTYTYESQTVSGFTINSNANAAFTGNVYWMAKQIGEV